MKCDQFRARMVELLDADPEPAPAELLHHASDCQNCARELEASRLALDAVTPSRKLTASLRFKEKTMDQITRLHAATPRPGAVTPEQTSGRRKWIYGFAAAAAAAVAIGTTLFTNPGVGFAQVVEKLAQARVFSFTTSAGVPGMKSSALRMSFSDSGAMRLEVENSMATIVDPVAKKGIVLYPPVRQYMELDLSSFEGLTPAGGPSATQQAGSIGHNATALAGQQLEVVEELRRLAADAGRPVMSREENGRRLQAFRAGTNKMNYMIWADEKTGGIVRAEYETPSGGLKGVLSAFEYHADVDDQLFSLQPPPGYTAMAQTLTLTNPSEEALVKLLRYYAENSEGSRFPEALGVTDVFKRTEVMKVISGGMSVEAALQAANKHLAGQTGEITPQDKTAIYRLKDATLGYHFARQTTETGEFHYAGAGVALGASETPICWYKANGAANYRVIYGDLAVREVPPDQVPSQE